MKLTVYYEDVFNNWYKQIVNIIYNASSRLKNGEYIGNVNYCVENEILISKDEINNKVYNSWEKIK